MLTTHSSSPAQASSWTPMSPVTCAGARQEAGVVLAGRLDARGDVRGVAQEPDLVAGAEGQPPGIHRQAHGPVERAHQHRQPAPRGPGDQQLVGLVGAHQQRRAELLEQGHEAVGLGVVERDGGRGRRRSARSAVDLRTSPAASATTADMRLLLHGSCGQSSFRIVPMPRFLVNSELLLLPNRSR